ncbi:uncharacterized protein BKA78DRAFT_340689 [Phyllosticta capitalensis]|uniref:uncharacterized protein n=1 Tax=Phyllosticta capitalensis TaxID=121624 RepID=UPI00312DCF41
MFVDLNFLRKLETMAPSTVQPSSDAGDDKKAPCELSISDGPITLQVCTRRFVTTRDTLRSGSPYFEALLSSRWAHNVQSDGSIFIDADPDLFAHILRFLRREVYPVFFDVDKGHDYALYTALQEEGRYFRIDKLFQWLEEKRYLKVVIVQPILDGRTYDFAQCPAEGTEIDSEPFYDNYDLVSAGRGATRLYWRHVSFNKQACLSWLES